MRVLLVAIALATACTPAQAPIARTSGKIMSIGGVLGLMVTALASRYVDDDDTLLVGFSVMSGLGIVTFAYGDLNAEPVVHQETIPERNHRWAKILTERAAGAAREGRCARVRRLERKVAMYDNKVHDLVFMRDPEIVHCLELPAGPDPVKAAPEDPLAPAPESPPPAP